MSIASGTFFGIEIEICVETDKYYGTYGFNDLDMPYMASTDKPWTLPAASGEKLQIYAGNNTRNITLSIDNSCICPPDMISAEIISPKMNKKNYLYYEQFLVNKLFDKMTAIKQGQTCGIHIHWSNGQIIPHKYLNNDPFMFLLAYNLIRMSNIFEKHNLLTNPEFSGRYDVYSEQNRMDIDVSKVDDRIIMAGTRWSSIPLYSTDGYGENNVVTLFSAYSQISQAGHISWTGFNLDKCLKFFTKHIAKDDKKQFADDLRKCLRHINKTSPDPSKPDYIIYNNLLKQLFNMSHIYKLSNNNLLSDIFIIDEINHKNFDLLIFIAHYSIFVLGVISKMENISGSETIFDIYKEEYKSENIGKYITENEYREHRNVLEMLVMIDFVVPSIGKLSSTADVSGSKIISALIDSNFKHSLNLIDLKNFLNNHSELRIFSLDYLFRNSLTSPTGSDIVKCLRKYIKSTDNFMNAIYKNMLYFFKQSDDITKSDGYKKFFLYEKYSTGKFVRERFEGFFSDINNWI